MQEKLVLPYRKEEGAIVRQRGPDGRTDWGLIRTDESLRERRLNSLANIGLLLWRMSPTANFRLQQVCKINLSQRGFLIDSINFALSLPAG